MKNKFKNFHLTTNGKNRIFNHMVKYHSHRLDVVFSALSDPNRRTLLERLRRRTSSVTQLADTFDISLPAVSKHLRILENAGLLVREKKGRVHRCHLQSKPLKDAAEWLDRYRRFWEERFDALDTYLRKTKKL